MILKSLSLHHFCLYTSPEGNKIPILLIKLRSGPPSFRMCCMMQTFFWHCLTSLLASLDGALEIYGVHRIHTFDLLCLIQALHIYGMECKVYQ